MEPEMPAWLSDRPADVWESLIALADAAGGAWPERARRAAQVLEAGRRSTDVSLGLRLLADLHTVFPDGEDKLATVTLLERLNALDEAPWGNLRGKPLDGRGLARRLSRYDIGPKPVWVAGETVKGYERADLADVWARYLSLDRASVRPVRPVRPDGDNQAAGDPDLTLLTDLTDAGGRQTWPEANPDPVERWYGDDPEEVR
jgi:hypothetical protein